MAKHKSTNGDEKRYYWLELPVGFFQCKIIKRLRHNPRGDTYTIIYLKMLELSLETDGLLYFEGKDEDFASQIALEIDEDIDDVRNTLIQLLKYQAICQKNDKEFMLNNVGEISGSETESARRKRAQRAKQKQPPSPFNRRLDASHIVLPSGKIQSVDEKRYGGNGMHAYELSGGICEMCGSENRLLIHHANGYSNEPKDLYILCMKCHRKAHALSTPKDWLHHNWLFDTDCVSN